MIVSILAASVATISLSGAAMADDALHDQDGVITTAPRTGGQSVPLDGQVVVSATPSVSVTGEAVTAPHGLSTDEQINRWLSQRAAATSPDQGLSQGWDEPEERRMRSEVSLGVGTGGYRDYAASVTMPLGENGALSLSVSQTKNSPYDVYYPYGYGLSGMDYWGLSRWRTSPGFAPPYRALPLERRSVGGELRLSSDRRDARVEGEADDNR